MTTRSKNNIHKSIQKLTFTTTLNTHLKEPTTLAQAIKDPNWRSAMHEEFSALLRNETWTLVPPVCGSNLVGYKWIFRIKRNSDGTVTRYKVRLVAKGFHQRPGLDYHETFSPVVKPTIVRLVLSIAVSKGWKLRQLDINNVFLQGTLAEDVYMAQPPGFHDPDKPEFVCKLRKAIYGLKQTPHAWYHELHNFLHTSGFSNSLADTSLFIFHQNSHLIYLLVYVDDIIVIGDNENVVNKFIHCLAARFSLKDLGPLTYFLGVESNLIPLVVCFSLSNGTLWIFSTEPIWPMQNLRYSSASWL
jgi:histone deacetylase 1/2